MKTKRSAQYEIEPPMSHRISICTLRTLILSSILVFVTRGQLQAEDKVNYPDRKPLIVDNCPHVRLSNFSFENRYERSSYRFVQYMAWTNTGGQPIVAFEIVILRYDAFNQRINGVSWIVTGINSENWMPLNPGYKGSDITISSSSEEVFTGIAYVRAVRLKDGTIWRADAEELLKKLHEIAPDIEKYGSVNPDLKIKPN